MEIIQLYMSVKLVPQMTEQRKLAYVPKISCAEYSLVVINEEENGYTVDSEYSEPQDGYVYKKYDEKMSEDGYSCMMTPLFVSISHHEVSGQIYALENDLTEAKSKLKEEMLNVLNEELSLIEMMKYELNNNVKV